MAVGWESLIRLSRATIWGTTGTTGYRGFYLNADSQNLDFGAQAAARDQKLIGVRESLPDSFGIDHYYPRGEFTFQPRPDDLLMILAAHFQTVVVSGVGTYEFYRKTSNPQWTKNAGGGTNPYSFNLDVPLSQSFVGGGTGANGMRFTNCIVDRLTFNLKYGEDFTVTVGIKAINAQYFNYPAGFFSYPNTYGSLSAFSRFPDYQGTVSLSGESSLQFDSWTLNCNNNTEDRASLGDRTYSRFPFSGKWIADGEVTMEAQRDMNVFAPGSTANLTMSAYAAANALVQVTQPNIIWQPNNYPVGDGASVIDFTAPYRAYAPSGTTGPSTIVRVVTGSTYGSLLVGFDSSWS